MCVSHVGGGKSVYCQRWEEFTVQGKCEKVLICHILVISEINTSNFLKQATHLMTKYFGIVEIGNCQTLFKSILIFKPVTFVKSFTSAKQVLSRKTLANMKTCSIATRYEF